VNGRLGLSGLPDCAFAFMACRQQSGFLTQAQGFLGEAVVEGAIWLEANSLKHLAVLSSGKKGEGA
jgi:hypothetical protein